MLTEREGIILSKFYENSPQVFTSEILAVLLNVSSRTIKNDLGNLRSTLKKYNIDISSERGKGYWLDGEEKKKFTKELKNQLFKKTNSEYSEILEFLLFRKKYIPVYEIAEKFYFSESALLEKLREINLILDKYDSKIVKETSRGIKLIGSEKNQRIIYAEILKSNHILGEGLCKFKDESQFDKIKIIQSILLEFQRKHEVGLSDIAKAGLIIDVLVALNRIETNRNFSISDEEINKLKLDKEWYYALELSSMLEESFDIEFTKSEIGYLSIHLMAANPAYDKLPNTIKELDEQSDSRLLELLINWIKEIDNDFNTDLEHDLEFISSLLLHLKPLLKRINYGMNLINPWIKELKQEHQKAYEMAVILSQKIQKEFNKSITENEVAYIAMHIGGALEREELLTKLDAIIICGSGVGTSNFLKARIKKFFPELNVIKVFSSANSHLRDYEDKLIITTVPINSNNNNIVRVSPLMNESDQKKIRIFLDNQKSSELDIYFKDKIFRSGFKAGNKVDVIRYAANLLLEEGYVTEDYYSSVLERETMSSTEIGNLIAIPHAFSGTVKKQGVCVTILEKPIVWDNSLVQIVFTLALDNKLEGDIFHVFEDITNLRDDLDAINRMVRAKNFEEFKKIFQI